MAVGGAGALAALGWAGFTPIDRGEAKAAREEIFEIPQGTWARRMSGDKVGILPDEIRLTLGIRESWCCGTWTTCRRSSVRP